MPDSVFPHFLAGLVLLSRIGDAASTYLVTPTLSMEMNAIARRGGWRLILLSLVACLLPYYDAGLGVAVLTTSFLATGSNLSRCWLARALGESEYHAVFMRAANRTTPIVAVACVLAAAACPSFLGLLMVWFSRGAEDWGYWFGVGVIGYGIAIALHGTSFVLALFRQVPAEKAAV